MLHRTSRYWILPALVAALIFPVFLVGCGPTAGEDSDRLQVAVSIRPQQWLVEQLAGDLVRVVVVLPDNANHHAFSPSDAEVSRILRSRLFFTIGLPFEEQGPLRGGAEAGRRTNMEVVSTLEGLPMIEIDHVCDHGDDHHHHHHHHDHGGLDPHVWLSPRLLKMQAATMADALIRVAPEHEQTFLDNLLALQAKLDELHHTIQAKLEPHRGRAMLVYHPAWGYFAHDFGLRQVAIEISGQAPSDHQLTELLRTARQENTRVVFVQPQINDVVAAAIARQINGRVEYLNPLGPDVHANLLEAAERVVASFEEPAGS